MSVLEAPTGIYSLLSLQQLSYGIRRALGLPVLDYEDLYHDLILYLLEGHTLSKCCILVKKKYKGWSSQVSYDKIPEVTIYTLLDSGNHRKITPKEKEAYKVEFYRKVDALEREDQTVVLLRTFGLTHAQIAKTIGISHAAVRKRMERIMRRMKV